MAAGLPCGRLPARSWPVFILVLLLQRAPLLRWAIPAESLGWQSAVAVLRSGLAAASLGAYHSLAGATTLSANPSSPANATVGQSFSMVFAIVGAPKTTSSYEITGALPPGLLIAGLNGTLLNANAGTITGSPTAAGSYVLTVRGWEFPNKAGLGGERSFTIRLNVQTASGQAAPVFVREPFTTSVIIGATATFSVEVSGAGPITYQWSKDGVDLPGATAATLTLANVTSDAAGVYRVTATNLAGPSLSNGATLFVNPPPVVSPTVIRSPVAVTVGTGSTAVFEVNAAGSNLTYQWRRDGQAIAGATEALLVLLAVDAASAGMYSAIVRNSAGSVVSGGAALTVAAAGASSRLTNLSVRSQAGLGEKTLIAGFNLSGAGPATLLVRAVGPTLGAFGVTGFLANPRLELYDAAQQRVAGNDDWSGQDGSRVGGFALPAGSLDAVLSSTLATGGYTAQVKTEGTSTGEALVEVYEVPSESALSALTNLSARTQLERGQTLITGFNLSGATGRTVLIRAIGPGLRALGVNGPHPDPKIELYNAGGTRIAGNDSWGGGPALTQVMAEVGAFALADPQSKDASVVATLAPGGYTAQVSGASEVTDGVVIVEVYLLR